MHTRQQLHDEQLSLELNALRQLHLGFQSLEEDLNNTHTKLVVLAQSHAIHSSIFGYVLSGIERFVIGAFADKFGIDYGE